MTRRGAVVLLFALVPIALGAAYGPLLPIGVVGFGIAVALVAIDARRAPGADRLRVRRQHDEILSVGRANPVSLRVDLTGGGPVTAMVRDEYPARLVASAMVHRVVLPGEVSYTLTPASRGEEDFGATTIRTVGPLGLGLRQSTIDAAETVKVDADLSAVRAYEALARRGQLAELGVRTRRRSGEGTEFERIREAVPDDSLRFINWKATARSGRLMTTELIPERAQPVIVCLDHGRLMGVGAGALTKLDHAINAAVLLVHVALSSGDRVGLLAFSDQITVRLPPRSGRLQLRRFLDAVRPLRAGEVEADYDEALTYFSHWQSRRALLAIFTDVLDPDQGQALIRQCVRLGRRHVPLVITVRDPALEDAARARPVDSETTYARAVAGDLLADREDTVRLLRRSGIDTLDADARTLSPRLVNRYLELKRRSRV